MADAGALSRAPAQGAAHRHACGARRGLGKKGRNKCKVRLRAACLRRCREESPLRFTGPPAAGPTSLTSLGACTPATIATRDSDPRLKTGNQIIDFVRESGRAQQLTGGIRCLETLSRQVLDMQDARLQTNRHAAADGQKSETTLDKARRSQAPPTSERPWRNRQKTFSDPWRRYRHTS